MSDVFGHRTAALVPEEQYAQVECTCHRCKRVLGPGDRGRFAFPAVTHGLLLLTTSIAWCLRCWDERRL